MSYTNWEIFKDYLSEDDFNYLNQLDDSIKEKITSILPYPIRTSNDLEIGYKDEVIKTINSSLTTLRIIDDTLKNPYSFPITELPNRLNYVGNLSYNISVIDSEDSIVIALSFKDLLYAIENGYEINTYKFTSLNPNIDRIIYLLLGESVSNVHNLLDVDMWIDLILEDKLELYRKNIDGKYDKELLTFKERTASRFCITKEGLVYLITALKVLLGLNKDSAISDVKSWLMYLQYLIMHVEHNKDKLIGYEYEAEDELKIKMEDTHVGDYLKRNLEFSTTEVFDTSIGLKEVFSDICESIIETNETSTIKYSKLSEILISKYNLDKTDIESNVKYVESLSGEVKGEALVIIYMLKGNYDLPVLLKFKTPEDYIKLVNQYKLPLNELLKVGTN